MTASLDRGADIAVIGAAGKTGTAVVSALESLAPVRRVVHTARQAGDHAVDLESGSGLHDALSGCRSAYFIAPNLHPDEPALLRTFLGVAQDVGVEHVVYHSVAWPYSPSMPHHMDKARCEDELHTFAGDLRWTVLQPCAYAENFSAVLDGHSDLLEVPYDTDALFSFVALADVGEVAARVLHEGVDLHHGATYELGGPQAVSVRELCNATGRSIAVIRVPVSEWMDRHGRSLTTDARHRLSAMFDFYDRHGFVVGHAATAALLGREPTSVVERAQDARTIVV